MVHLQDVYNKRVHNKQIPSFRRAPIHYINNLNFFHQVPFSDTQTNQSQQIQALLCSCCWECFSLSPPPGPPLILMIMLGPVGAHCVYHINYLIIYWQFICFHRCLCASCFYALLCFCTLCVMVPTPLPLHDELPYWGQNKLEFDFSTEVFFVGVLWNLKLPCFWTFGHLPQRTSCFNDTFSLALLPL